MKFLSRQFKSEGYYINLDSLTHHKRAVSFKWVIRLSIAFVFTSALLVWGGINIYYKFHDTPKEQLLSIENVKLQDEFIAIQSELNDLNQSLEDVHSKDDSLYRALFGMKKIASTVWESGIGGTPIIERNKHLKNEELVKYTQQKLNELEHKIKLSTTSYADLLEEAMRNRDKLAHIPAIMPVENRTLKRTGSGFGMRHHPILDIYRMHEGIDFIADKGTPVFATGKATIKKQYRSKTFGNVLILDHGYGFESFYAHLTKYQVQQGEKVSRGDTIGYMGSTGLSSGVHLHYEIHLNGKEIDPVNYFYGDLSPEQYQQIVQIANSFEMSLD